MHDVAKEKTGDIIQSVDVAIDVLLHVAKHPDIRLSDISRNIEETKPRILRMLRTLEQRELVRKSKMGTYRLGNTAIVSGNCCLYTSRLGAYSKPYPGRARPKNE